MFHIEHRITTNRALHTHDAFYKVHNLMYPNASPLALAEQRDSYSILTPLKGEKAANMLTRPSSEANSIAGGVGSWRR